MTVCPQTDVDHGLAYFGQMTASLSHEMKNYLAIINENAGLMEDLSMMASMGKELDPERILGVCRNITTQVKRADETIKIMNAFGHSIDRPRTCIGICETMNLTMNLAMRLLRSRSVQVECQASEELQVTTNPFFFMNLLWLVVDYTSKNALENGQILLSAHRHDEFVNVVVSCPGQDVDSAVRSLLSRDSVVLLLDSLHGSLTADDKNTLVITLPKSLGQNFCIGA